MIPFSFFVFFHFAHEAVEASIFLHLGVAVTATYRPISTLHILAAKKKTRYGHSLIKTNGHGWGVLGMTVGRSVGRAVVIGNAMRHRRVLCDGWTGNDRSCIIITPSLGTIIMSRNMVYKHLDGPLPFPALCDEVRRLSLLVFHAVSHFAVEQHHALKKYRVARDRIYPAEQHTRLTII